MFFDLISDLFDVLDFVKDSIVDQIIDIPNIPMKVIDKTVDILVEVDENWEAATVLVCASIGVAYIIGKVVLRVPPILNKKMLAPVIAVVIVRSLAKSAEGKANNVAYQQNVA